MVIEHRAAQFGQFARLFSGIAQCFAHQARLVQQLVALQYFFLVPGQAAIAEAQPHAGAAQLGGGGIGRVLHEFLQGGQDDAVNQSGPRFAPVFPGKILIPAAPARIRRLGLTGPRQSEIAHRHNPRPIIGRR